MKRFLIDSIDRLDLIVWLLVILFFCSCALLFGGDVQHAFIGAGGIIIEMLLIGLSIEIILESLKNIKGIGTITGFITNGPEALCLIVGLVVGDVLFAASTPLGSNFMNPVLLIIAALICAVFLRTIKTHPVYSVTCIALTATLALSFYLIKEEYYLFWLVAAVVVTVVLFFKRPTEKKRGELEDVEVSKVWFWAALVILTASGYFLDTVVSFASEHSNTPKGVIGFVVLATLTSWPEFKSTLALLSKGKILAAIMNITVSNITNIWLASGGVAVYLFLAK